MSISRTVVIGCAGMGNRLGLGTTKALVEIEGKPLIIRLLEMLNEEEDVRIVVGYQAEQVIACVCSYRKDILFVFNHSYKNTGTGASVALASRYANKYILNLDGDLLIHPDDMGKILKIDYEFVSGGQIETDDPWLVQAYKKNGIEYASGFSKKEGQHEWNGIVQIESQKMLGRTGHVFQSIEPYLPLPYIDCRTKEIDTINDYERAITWIKNGYC